MPLFDAYDAVDWSAAKTRGRGAGSIWVAVGARGGRATVENPPTRAAAANLVRDVLADRATAGERLLVGFDFAYSYPRGFADAVAPGPAAPWRRVWDALSDL